MLERAWRFAFGVILVGGLFLNSATPIRAASCSFELGFKVFHELTGNLVGNCVADEQHNPTNGDGLQSTTKGLLVWRKLDNWTAFTDGYHTWINGPYGIQGRLNVERFAWEGGTPTGGNLPVLATTSNANQPGWLARLNALRSLARLPGVSEDAGLDSGALDHARYMVMTGTVAHSEDPSRVGYSASGDATARASDLIAFSWLNSDSAAIDGLVEGPFHALSLLDPSMTTVGFASYRDSHQALETAADVHLGASWGAARPTGSAPMVWPADGATTNLRHIAQGEHPDPLSPCPGYNASAGVPVLFALGAGASGTTIGGHSLLRDGSPVESCVYDASSYVNPDAASQTTGQEILGMYNAVVLVPRQALNPGSTYSVSLDVNGQTYHWSFKAA